MKTVQYGSWKIAVDLEKTREYYKSYVIKDSQANRNFAEYCKIMSENERAFFDSFGISPECCEIEHIGVSKKKSIPCGGYYLICGSYLEYPDESLIWIEEPVENDFADDSSDITIKVGIFEFDFQCEEYEFKIIPENMPNGFICVRFWCEDMKWLLDEKPEMMMHEPPRFWELGKIIKENQENKKQRALFLESRKKEFESEFKKLGITYSEILPKEYKKYRKQWVGKFSPDNADIREIKKLCVANRRNSTYLWHIFSFDFLDVKTERSAMELYDNANKTDCVLISEIENFGFKLKNAGKLTSETLENFIDVTVTANDFSWTYSKTHESYLGPYFYKK